METPIKAKTGEERKLEAIIGRQKLKKSFQYEVKFRGLDHKFNAWIPRERLIELGFSKVVQQHDDLEASREGSGSRDLSFKAWVAPSQSPDCRALTFLPVQDPSPPRGRRAERRHCGIQRVEGAQWWAEGQGRHRVRPASPCGRFPADFACAVLLCGPSPRSSFSTSRPTSWVRCKLPWGQAVLTASADRDALGGLAVAIRDWGGAFLCISHNEEFIGSLCTEIWNVEAGKIIHKGQAAQVDGDAFEDGKRSKIGTPTGSRVGSKQGTPRSGTPVASATPSATNSGAENGADGLPMPVVKKKKLTRKQLKDREERRRLRKLRWLSDSTGAPREPDTDTGAFMLLPIRENVELTTCTLSAEDEH